MLKITRINDSTSLSSFSTPTGCDEFFVTADTRPGASFTDGLDELSANYSLALKNSGLSPDTAVFSRLFVSDIVGQKEALASSPLFTQLTKGSLSVIEQKPVNNGPLSLLSYHIRCGNPPRGTARISADGMRNTALFKGRNYSLLFTANFTSDASPDVFGQTTDVFKTLDSVISDNGMLLTENAVRTWVFVRDIDNNYGEMVSSRKKFFEVRGLTDKTRYLASTGIQGVMVAAGQVVSLDCLSMGGLRPGQIVRMEAPDHLSPTIQYGVTFERGLRVRFGDRSHLYISGTASIDSKGDVLFTGDAGRQTERTVENVRALLHAHGADLRDMAYMIAYVRNGSDGAAVKKVLDREIGGDTPLIFSEAAVCRPSWLVELEGVAVIQDRTEFPHFI